MEEAKEFGYEYVQNNVCYDDLVRKLSEAYLEWFEQEQKHSENEDINRLVEEQGITEGEAWTSIEDWIYEFFEKNLTRLWDYV